MLFWSCLFAIIYNGKSFIISIIQASGREFPEYRSCTPTEGSAHVRNPEGNCHVFFVPHASATGCLWQQGPQHVSLEEDSPRNICWPGPAQCRPCWRMYIIPSLLNTTKYLLQVNRTVSVVVNFFFNYMKNTLRSLPARLLAGKLWSRDERRESFVNTTREIPQNIQRLSSLLSDSIPQGMG